jgi:hypothetical protein
MPIGKTKKTTRPIRKAPAPHSNLVYIEEPLLQFRFDQALVYPRDGLYLFGPVDAGEHPRQIKYGVIGTQASVARFERWAESVSQFIDVPGPRPGAKAIEPHHVPFPGFSEAFHSTWAAKPHRRIADIDQEDLLKRLSIGNRYESIKTTVDVFFERLTDARRHDEDPPSFWYVVVPEFVHKRGRPQFVVPPAERIKGKVTITEAQALALERAPSLFGDDEEQAQVYKYARDFRRQLKARLLDHEIVTQIVRETTLAPEDFLKRYNQPIRRVEDPATIAWKLCTGSYYKSGGKPWQLANVRSGVCYVGLVYKQQPTASDPRWACCAAQMFLSDGEGVVFRGALGPWYNPDTKQCHLDLAEAQKLAALVLEEYRSSHGSNPAELFIHARSGFELPEWEGFKEACSGATTNVVAVQIAKGGDRMKLFRPGPYPTIRGTAFRLNDRQAYLWTSGYVPRLDTYLGPETPNPLHVAIRYGDADLNTVLSDVMALGKVNFNSCLFNDRSPVTIRFADAIGDILVSAPPPQKEPRLPFKFYI